MGNPNTVGEVRPPRSIAEARALQEEDGIPRAFSVGMPENPPPEHLLAAQRKVLEAAGIVIADIEPIATKE